MLKYRRIAAFLISFFFFCPNDAFAHRAGEYVPLNASVTADSLTGAESIDLENYQFEGSNVSDTNIHDSGTDFIGYGETRYPVAVVSAGEITDVPNDLAQDIFQFEQQLLVEGSEIYRLFQKYQSENLTPEQQSRFNSAWQDVVNGYSETIARLDEGINPGETARQRLSGKTIQDVLQHIPELSVTGGLTVHVDANTDPTSSEERRRNIFALMSSIGRENWNRAQEAAESIQTLMSGHSFADTQIVGRTDLYQPAYQYEGNVLTLQITSRGGMSTSGGESLISQYSHNDDGGLECHTVSSTEEARQYGTDVYCLALETIRIDYTPENAAKLRQMQAELDALDDGNNWFSLSYQTVLSTFEKYFPDYDTSTLWNEFSRVDAEKKQRSEHAEGSALVNISVESPQTPGLVTDSDISSTTSATFDSVVFLLMGEESAGSDEDPRPALSVPTDLADSAGKDARRLRQQFIDDYILSAGYECLTQVELTSRYAHDAYTPNEEIYEIEEKYTGALGSIHRLFAGNFPAYNKLTGSCEYITHASESDYDYICFCAGTNGWIRIKDGNDQVRYIRSSDFISAANTAASERGYGDDLVSGCYMVCAGENNNKGHVLELRLDSAALADHIFRKLSVDEMKRMLGDHEITLQELKDLLTNPYEYHIQDGHLTDGFDEYTQRVNDWWKDIITEIIRDTDDDNPFDDIPGLQGDEVGEGKTPEDSGADDVVRFTLEDFIQWLIEQGYIKQDDGQAASDEEIIQWMTDYFPEYLNHYSGRMVFSVDRIVTKQLKKTVSRATSRYQNVGYPEQGGTHKWTVTTNGFPAAPYYGGSASGVTLAAGTTSVTASERVRQIHEDAVTYDYTEEWVLEPFGFVMFRKSVEGRLAGVDGQTHDVNTVYFSTTLGPITEKAAGNWSFTAEDDECGQELPSGRSTTVSFGAITTIMSRYGYWINGIPYSEFSAGEPSVSRTGTSFSYRIQ